MKTCCVLYSLCAVLLLLVSLCNAVIISTIIGTSNLAAQRDLMALVIWQHN